MSALRTISRPARPLPSFVRQRRLASTASHDSHHHHEEHDSSVYTKETFFTPFWRNTVLLTLGVIAYAKYAPDEWKSGKVTPEGEYEPPWFTRVLEHYAPSVDGWFKTNARHLAQSEEKAQNTLTVQSAKLPPKLERTTRLNFEQASPHRVPVGGVPSLDDLVVKPAV